MLRLSAPERQELIDLAVIIQYSYYIFVWEMLMYIALVNVRCSEKPVIPMGLLSLAAMLEKHGFTVTIDDLVYEEEELKLIERLAETKPDIIGFSFLTTAVARTINLVDKAAKAVPHAVRIGGGAARLCGSVWVL